MGALRTLTLTEHHTASDVALSPEERDALRCLVPELTIVPALGRPGRYDLTPGSWVGTVRVTSRPTPGGAPTGGLAVELRPKLPISSMLFLLAYTLDPRAWRTSPFDFAASTLTSAVVPALLAHARAATRRGLLHGYRAEAASLSTVRGRIVLEEQARRRWGAAPPVEVRYDDFTPDIQENQLLKAALLAALRLPVAPAQHTAVAALLPRFEPVAHVSFAPRHVPEVVETPLNAHYLPALRLARLILAGAAMELGHGPVPGTAFLVDMSQLFEDFIVVALREALGLDERAFPQSLGWRRAMPEAFRRRQRRLPLDTGGSVHLRPDFSWWEGSRCVFAGDAKYKHARPTGPLAPESGGGAGHADLYQLLAYTVAASLPGGLLVYAADAGDSSHQASKDRLDSAAAYHVAQAGKALHVATLDLAQPPDEILRQVGALAALIRRLRARTAASAPHARARTA